MESNGDVQPVAGSFRDPSGRVFRAGGVLYRRVERSYAPHFDRLLESGLYETLVREGLLVPHEEVRGPVPGGEGAYRVLCPAEIPFVSYPYEWSFPQLRAAALLTLRVQRLAVERGMVLKDASAFNVQFVGTRPVLIDTLSFETRVPGAPWVAYRQFCRHFLAPLWLAGKRDPALLRLLASHLDGVPLDLARRLLPWTTKLRPGVLFHVALHARSETAAEGRRPSTRTLGEAGFQGLLDSLERAVRAAPAPERRSAWSHYAPEESYAGGGREEKRAAVARIVKERRPRVVWDLGANTGEYSRIAADAGAYAIAMDGDPFAVQAGYASLAGEARVLPLVIDLAAPTPAVGWAHEERDSLLARGPADLALALALVHHLAIANNVPLPRVAAFLASAAKAAVVEFVPKEDPQVRRMLASREDVFPAYDAAHFETACEEWFTIAETIPLPGSKRALYVLERKLRDAGSRRVS